MLVGWRARAYTELGVALLILVRMLRLLSVEKEMLAKLEL
jgi:hypothetical protein